MQFSHILILISLFPLTYGCGNCDDDCPSGDFCTYCDPRTCTCTGSCINPATHCNKDPPCGGSIDDNPMCNMTEYQNLMCIRCPASCSLCVICNQTKPAKPVVWNCRGINLTYEGKSYCLITDATNFDNAESICQGNGTSLNTQGHISSVKSAFVNSYFLDVMKQNNIAEIWIGSASILNLFYYNFDIWLDGTPLRGYTHFAPNADPTYVPSYLSLKSDGMWYSHVIMDIVKYKDATTTLPYIFQAPVKYINT